MYQLQKINDLQQKVIMEGKSKGCLSLIPLPKIDEMYAKLKGAKFFSTIDLRSGYYHIALGKDSRARSRIFTQGYVIITTSQVYG